MPSHGAAASSAAASSADVHEGPAEPLGAVLHEQARQRRDVVAALAQRRDADLDDVEAIEQVAAEAAGGHLDAQVAVGRGEHLDVDAARLERADAVDLSELEDAQQLGLDAERQIADLVEQQHAAVGGLEQAGAVFHRPREGAADVAEQLALEQRLDDRGTVHDDEGLLPAAAGPVQRARRQLLAGAGLAGDERGPHERREAADGAHEVAHRGRAPDHPVDLAGVGLGLALLLAPLGDVGPDLGQQLLDASDVERLAQVVHRADLDGFDRGLDARVAGHEDHLAARVGLVDRAEDLQAVHAGHPQIDHHEVGPARAGRLDTRFAVGSARDVEAGPLTDRLDRF